MLLNIDESLIQPFFNRSKVYDENRFLSIYRRMNFAPHPNLTDKKTRLTNSTLEMAHSIIEVTRHISDV